MQFLRDLVPLELLKLISSACLSREVGKTRSDGLCPESLELHSIHTTFNRSINGSFGLAYSIEVVPNLGNNEETTIRETAELIAAAVTSLTGRNVRPVFDPSGITGQPRRCCDTTKALEMLGYTANVSLRTGLRRTVEWYLNQ